MNRYLFSTHNYEYSHDIFFLHEKEYTTEEFTTIVNDALKKAIVLKANTTPMDVLCLIEPFDKYDAGPLKVETNYGNGHTIDSYDFITDVPTYYNEIISILTSEYGFILEELPVPKAVVYVNEYTYIQETMLDDLIKAYQERVNRDSIPVINRETKDAINEIIDKIGDKEEAKKVMVEYLKSKEIK